MRTKHIFQVFLTIAFVAILPIFSLAQSVVCHIDNPDQFLKKINAQGTKTIEFQISGLAEQKDVDAFVAKASGSEKILNVKVSGSNSNSRKVTVRIDEKGDMNSFRLMLMSASVKTLTTPSKTFEVLRLPVKKTNPFE